MRELKRLVIPLLAWYNENKRPLPWRQDREPYHIWVSEIMLQQTRVAAVFEYYRRFLEHFPTISALAQADEESLMKCWQGLGYYSRARNLQKTARIICSEYDGNFPNDYLSIRSLPGIGDYTAGAIAAIAFGQSRAAVDGNVLRVVARLTANPCDTSAPAVRREIAAQLEAVMPVKAPGDFNQALMELGATVCLPNGAPLCHVCPARDFCRAHKAGTELEFPVKPGKRPRRVEERAVYLLFHQGRTALRKRPENGLLAGLWEFPNTLETEPPPLALPQLEFAGTAKHIFTHIEWHMTLWAGEVSAPALPQGWVWAGGGELEGLYSIPSAFSAARDIALAQLKEKGDR